MTPPGKTGFKPRSDALLAALSVVRLSEIGGFFVFFFCIPNFISGVHRSSFAFPTLSLGFTVLLLLRSQLDLRGSPFFFFFFCVHSYISEFYHSSSSPFPAISLDFTILLRLYSQLYLWVSPFFSVCVPSYISGFRHSSSSAFPAISLGFTILGEIFAYVTDFTLTKRVSYIPFWWMVHAGCVFVVRIF